jgi:hypothetical protein
MLEIDLSGLSPPLGLRSFRVLNLPERTRRYGYVRWPGHYTCRGLYSSVLAKASAIVFRRIVSIVDPATKKILTAAVDRLLFELMMSYFSPVHFMAKRNAERLSRVVGLERRTE